MARGDVKIVSVRWARACVAKGSLVPEVDCDFLDLSRTVHSVWFTYETGYEGKYQNAGKIVVCAFARLLKKSTGDNIKLSKVTPPKPHKLVGFHLASGRGTLHCW